MPEVVESEVSTVSVEVPEPPAIVAGLKLQVGFPWFDPHSSVTVPENPYCGEIVIVAVAEFPAVIVLGEKSVAAMRKSPPGGSCKVRFSMAVLTMDPEVPVTVTG